MSFDAMLDDTCDIEALESMAVDADRNFVRTVTTVMGVRCRLLQQASTEPTDGAVGVTARLLLFLPAGTAITAASRVVMSNTRHYRVDGDPNRVHGRFGEHHVEAVLLRASDVEGG